MAYGLHAWRELGAGRGRSAAWRGAMSCTNYSGPQCSHCKNFALLNSKMCLVLQKPKYIPRDNPFPLKYWLQVSYPLLKAASFAGLPWIWISMDISMCGYQTLAISMDIYGYLWIFLCDCIRISDITKPQQNEAKQAFYKLCDSCDSDL